MPDTHTTTPRISLVMPSYNQLAFIEASLRSVLDQRYANLQFIVVDGQSTDGTIDLLEGYRAAIETNGGKLIIASDRGQTEAINKGLHQADGELSGWLCSDDLLLPGALDAIAEARQSTGANWIAGPVRMFEAEGEILRTETPTPNLTLRKALLRGDGSGFSLPQPGVFWERALHDQLGYLREDLHYTMDFEWWLRLLAAGHAPTTIDTPIADYRLHADSKTCSAATGFTRDHIAVESVYARQLPLTDRLAMRRRLGYMARAAALADHAAAYPDRAPWQLVARRPWWLLSQQVRAQLKCAA